MASAMRSPVFAPSAPLRQRATEGEITPEGGRTVADDFHQVGNESQLLPDASSSGSVAAGVWSSAGMLMRDMAVLLVRLGSVAVRDCTANRWYLAEFFQEKNIRQKQFIISDFGITTWTASI